MNPVERPKWLLTDLVVTALVPILAIWLYELSNWIVLAGQGCRVSFSVAGWLPLGVSAVSTDGPSLWTKLVQVGVAVGFLVPLRMLFHKTGLLISETFIVSSAGIYLASTYWEVLSLVNLLPMAMHIGIFLTGVGATQFALLRWFSPFERREDAPFEVWRSSSVSSPRTSPSASSGQPVEV